MSFKFNWWLRNFTVSALFWAYGLTTWLGVYVIIKYMKFEKFHHWIYEIGFEDIHAHEIAKNYYSKTEIMPLLWYLPLAFITDLIIRRIILRRL